MVIKSLHQQVQEMRQSFFDEGARSNRGTHDYQMHSSVTKQQRQASYNIFVIIGASKVFEELKKANTSLKAGNIEGIKVALGDIKKEHSELRAKFETYFQLMRQAGPTDVAVNSS
ncbi:HPT domain superfamily [Arabidopsis suecica]|uniref:HPT domain superfamily n=1 Tax=Arabidopsis suecica TaxID=45249 RepID=A0A8T1ZA01_ARASU|nr:HPT domain superfamily [Arabidopsis suecica]